MDEGPQRVSHTLTFARDILKVGAFGFAVAAAISMQPSLIKHLVDHRYHDTPLFNGFVAGLLASSAGLAIVAYARWRTATREARLRLETEASLRESLARHQTLVENTFDLICELDELGRFVCVSPNSASILGYRPEELAGKAAFDFLHPDDVPMAVSKLANPPGRATVRFRHRNGKWRWLDATARRFTAAGSESRSAVIARDITADRQVQEELEKLSRAVDQTADLVLMTDREGVIQYVNPAFERLTGYERSELIGETPRVLKSGRHSTRFYRRVWETIRSGEVYRGTFVNRKKSGETYTEEKVISPITGVDGEVTHFVSTGRDVTESEEAQRTIQKLAYTDALTGLPNRALLQDRLVTALTQARRTGERVALIFLDIDHFKAVNDTVGHRQGDRLLRTVAEGLEQCTRAGDTVARFGGDEFVVICPRMTHAAEAQAVAKRILEGIRKPITLGGREFHVRASLGVAVFPEHGEDAVALLSAADAAMYGAKEAGRDRTEWYVSAMSARAVDRLDLESDLRQALEQGQFVLHYQPQANVRTGEITGVEALVRWNRPGHGLVPPAEFIPVAEETGLIVPIGKWVLETACAQARAWHEAGLSDLRIAVNLSAHQLAQPDLVATVKHVLATSAIPPALLELEITESLAMDDAHLTERVLDELKLVNVLVAIDDFGTGYSSLSYLKHFPISRIKIDRSFVRDVTTDPNDAAIVVATIAMAHGLGVNVIAEGIETAEQLEFLREHGCEEYQGFLLGKPMPADKITEALTARRSAGGQRPSPRQPESTTATSAR